MIYEYRCENSHAFDVVKPVSEMTRDEACPTCGLASVRAFVPSKVHFTKTKVTHAEYNPGLGAVVKNERHRLDLAKRKNLIPIGNDYKTPDSIHKESDTTRETRREERYERALKEAADG